MNPGLDVGLAVAVAVAIANGNATFDRLHYRSEASKFEGADVLDVRLVSSLAALRESAAMELGQLGYGAATPEEQTGGVTALDEGLSWRRPLLGAEVLRRRWLAVWPAENDLSLAQRWHGKVVTEDVLTQEIAKDGERGA